jgi:hypothetical protein
MNAHSPESPVLPPPNRLVNLVFAALAIVGLLGVGLPLAITHWRAALSTAPRLAAHIGGAPVAVPFGGPAVIPTPARPGDACPDPIAHTGPFDPRTGAARAGGYRIIPPR